MPTHQTTALNPRIATNGTARPWGMSPTLLQPILSVTADAVRGLEGHDALPALWNLFTKCKESLQEGRRLENISWRLWYRTMAFPTPTFCQDSQNTPDIEELLNEKIYRPLTPDDDSCLPPLNLSSLHSPCSQHTLITPADPSSQLSKPIALRRSSFRKGSTPVSVGKIICDIIPAAALSSLSSLTSVPSNTSTLSLYVTSTHTFDPRDTSSSLPSIKPSFALSHHSIPPTTQQFIMASCLPTPDTDYTEPTYPSKQSSSQSSQSPVVPSSGSNSLVVPVITTNDSALRQCKSNSPVIENLDQITAIPPPPRLVVVDPTPNPTPHATPPATPALPLGDGNSEENDTKPLLQVPGQDALIQAQVRARAIQLNKRSQSLESPSEERDVPHSTTINLSGELSVVEDDTNKAINTSRHSISSDATTSSSSHLGFYSSPSEYSNITAATTVSEFPFSDSSHAKPSSRNASVMITPLSPIKHPNGFDSQAHSPHSPARGDEEIVHESITSSATSIVSSKLEGSTISGKDGAFPSGRPNLTRRLSNNVGGGTKHRPVRDSSTSAKSRSRSRTRENSGTGLNGLVMTKVTSGKTTSGTRGRVVGSSRRGSQRKAPSRRTSVNDVIRETGEGLTKAMMFNIGSNSDEGSNAGSKSTGSGSEMGKKKFGTFESARVIDAMAGNVSRKEDVDVTVTSVPLEEVKELKESSFAPIIKGKEKEKEKVEEVAVVEDPKEKLTLVTKGKQKSVTFLETAIVPAHVVDTIADPLLPEATRRQIVITSDSEEYETEEDSWSSTESAEDEQTEGNQNKTTPSQRTSSAQKDGLQEELEQAELQRQYALQQAQQQEVQQQQFPQFPPRPNFLRTTSHNQVKNPRQFSRAQQQRLAAQQLALEQAREQEVKVMFTKLPKQTLKELKEKRSKSVGLLTQLLNPNRPPNRGYSSGAIQPLTPNTPNDSQPDGKPSQAAPKVPEKPPPTQFEVMQAQLRQVRAQMAPLPHAQAQQRQQQQQQHQRPHQPSRQPSRNYQMPQRMAAITRSSDGSNNVKTPLATAVTTQVQVGSVTLAQLPASAGIAVSTNGSAGKYRPKGRPPETVMEETDDGTDDDTDNDNQLDLSKSVAQERLKALLEAKKSRRGGGVVNQETQFAQQEYVSVDALDVPRHQFTLPLPVPPTTPRTTRRVMLVTEIPESLRRNLLWERQISQAKPVIPVPLLRSKSVGGTVAAGAGKGGMLDNMPPAPKGRGLPPGWTSVPNLVKLTPKGAKPDDDKEPKKVETEEEKRNRFLERNRSYAFEYHHAGW